MKKLQKWSLGIIVFCVLIIIFISVLPETEEQKAAKQRELAAKQQEAQKLVRIEQQIKAISVDESVGKYIKISSAKVDDSLISITIYLLFEPDDYQQVQTWTDAVCLGAKQILDSVSITRSISVWARRDIGNDMVKVYGNTFYSQHTGRAEFKQAK